MECCVSQDGADFYIFTKERPRHIQLVIKYPHLVKDGDVTQAVCARVWFEEIAQKLNIKLIWQDGHVFD